MGQNLSVDFGLQVSLGRLDSFIEFLCVGCDLKKRKHGQPSKAMCIFFT